MRIAREHRANPVLAGSLAGLQAGMVAVLWMLAWAGFSAKWHQSSFWSPENLLASTFYGDAAIRSGFSRSTLSGLALYLIVYSLLGCLFAAVAGVRLPRIRLMLVGILMGVAWYYLSFRLIWRTISPLVTLLHPVQSTVFGHVIFGALVARYPNYIPPAPGVPAAGLPEAPDGVPSEEPATSRSPES